MMNRSAEVAQSSPHPVLALDLEGTLISNAVSQIPRPGLTDFLTECRALFPRIVIFTTVREPLFRHIARGLLNECFVPAWFADLEYVDWSGPAKDLRVIPRVQWPLVLLVDDCQAYVHPGQEEHWVPIEQFCSPYRDTDRGSAGIHVKN
ncbi:NIF family HAD-type phosphatase, partial [Novilysobacter arseniciresistens]|uniref:NIF family HAD-type phosphatase n=1 Tax=Novilysobacter arseniciresistens TaxID=1385522 RepID=UPI001EEFAC5A